MRFPASSRYPHPGPPSRWFPRHRRRPPSGFRNLSAVCSPSTFAGLFHPASTSRLSLQGFSLAGSRHGSSPRSCLLVVTARFAPLAGRSTRGSASRPCSPGESVAFEPRLSDPSARSPPGLHPLQGLLHLGRRSCFHDPPLSSLPRTRTGRALRCSSGSCRTEGSIVSRETLSPL